MRTWSYGNLFWDEVPRKAFGMWIDMHFGYQVLWAEEEEASPFPRSLHSKGREWVGEMDPWGNEAET